MSKPFEAITWGQYLGVAFLLLAAYYLYVAGFYYRVELLAKFRGKGKAAAAPGPAVAVVSRPSLVGGSGSLIPKSALAIEVPATEEESEAAAPEETAVDENESETGTLDEVKIEEPDTDNITNLNHNEDEDELPGAQAPDTEEGFTVGVAQLADYFEDAAEGNITQEELVAQMPELDNTDLLVSFFQTKAKAAQQLTSQYYVDVPEPVLD